MSKVYKLRTDEVEEVKEALMKFVVNKKTIMKETDVIHALIKYHLKDLTAEEVLSKHPANTALPSDPISLNLVPT